MDGCWADNTLLSHRIYPTEIIPLYIRSKAVSLATFFNWSMNFSLTFFTPPAFRNIKWKVSSLHSTPHHPPHPPSSKHSIPYPLPRFNEPHHQHFTQTHLIFATFCICALIHVFLLFQETVGKSLEEMNDVFDNESVWAFKVKSSSKESGFSARLECARRAVEKGDGDGVELRHEEVEMELQGGEKKV
jgi:hypothetical protein